jgi:hypothetical protein
MKLDKIFLKNNSRFTHLLSAWANDRNYQLDEYSDKSEGSDEGIDGLVIFTENQEMDKDLNEIRSYFDNNQKPVHKIDINGTMMAGVSNLELWVERNRCKKVLFIGAETLLENANLERYLMNIK